MSARVKILGSAAVLALAAIGYMAPASAVPVNCNDTTHDYMKVDSSLVSSCLAAGTGNIGQGGGNDPFLNAHSGWTNIDEGAWTQLTKTKGQTTGTFSLDSSLWDDYLQLAIGFKFGTGNQPDEWFVYDLQHLISSGGWTFINTFQKGGGLSHVVIYGGEKNREVPEPATLGILGLGLLGLGSARRKKA